LHVVVFQLIGAVPDGSDHESRNGLLLEIERAGAGCVKVPVHPDEGFPGVQFAWRRVERGRETAVEVPG
jgi:hypothetical protein